MTSKERADLKGQAMNIDPVFQIGKLSISPELINAISECLEKRELIKISVLKNCADDPGELAVIISERTHSEVVQVIGKKIVLYKKNTKKKKNENRKD
ncbi:MAG: YhbY family RNA-binding protein [Lachnospiraceae bacterium]|nr:YhbY family RNA-binding protein [Lachnospiraceae bacterium]